MSDLIKREDVIQTLKETGIIQDNDLGHLVVDEINRIPTAYDVDKVVEELESRICTIDEYDAEISMRNKHYKTAIEIVKRGYVSDDVCEWRLCDEEANVYDTSCRNPHILITGTPEENNYEFCPYCGKKIKVVE